MILIPFPEMKLLTETLALAMGAELRTLDWHHFPDGESLMTLRHYAIQTIMRCRCASPRRRPARWARAASD